MQTFIDLIGASAATYRFRRGEALSPIGGNFVYLRLIDGKPHVVCCGAARSLGRMLATQAWFRDENAHPDDQLFVRLNASSGVRQSEHEDLIAALPRPFVIYESD